MSTAWASSTSTLINQFPAPPSTTAMQSYPQQQQQQQFCTATPVAYTAPAVISLGEEYTDATLPESQSSYLCLEDEDDEELDYDNDDDDDSSSDGGDYSPVSSNSPSPTALHGHLDGSSIPALWHAERARLVHLQAAVLDNEREARTRELKLESEVARIKDDLARLKEARAQTFGQPLTSQSSESVKPSSSTSPTAVQAPPQLRASGPRGPRPRPQSQRASTSASAIEASSSERPTSSFLGKFSFEDDDTTETVLSNHLTEARSARAQERQRRKKEYERMRELTMLLTLGSEVRKWEERLAWQQARAMASTPSSDDMNLESSTKSGNKDMDTDPDPRGKRLSRSSSLPSRGFFNLPPSSSSATSSAPATTNSNRSGPPSPALPSLAMSPLWRVSAEMILRRRSLSERPRRIAPKPLIPKVEQQQKNDQPATVTVSASSTTATSPTKTGSGTLARPAHVLRGPREPRANNSVSSNLASTPTLPLSPAASSPSSIINGSSSLSQNATGATSGSSITSSGKRYSVPPPITIPPNSQFCSSTTMAILSSTGTTSTSTTSSNSGTTGAALRRAGQCPSANSSMTFLLSKTTPVRPSALKWAFTADDLAREREELEAKTKEEAHSDSGSSSSEGESDDSRQSSSSSSSSSSPEESTSSQCVERRGRARFSWRKSLPKDSNGQQSALVVHS